MGQVVTTLARGLTWQARAACVGRPLAAFFPAAGRNLALTAVRWCQPCPVRADCLAWAVAAHEHGVWGGTTERERNGIRRRARKADSRGPRRAPASEQALLGISGHPGESEPAKVPSWVTGEST